MRLRTIWTMPAMTFAERLRRTREWAAQEIAARLPLRIRYWVAMQMIGKATMKAPNVPAADAAYVIRHLPSPKVVA